MKDEHDSIQEDTTRLISEEELKHYKNIHESHYSKPCLIVVAGGEIGKEYPVEGDEIIIGRCDSADVRINSRLISRRHAVIRRIFENGKERFLLEDLESRNGTFLNSNPIKTAYLTEGDKIQIGEVLLRFGFQDPLDEQFHQQIHRLIHYDKLTGLMTLESFRRVMEDIIHCAQPSEVFTLSMNDLDGLKRVNDTYGHLAGRMVIETMGAIIRKTLRSSDKAGLYGGDETIILYANTPINEAREIAERLRKNIASHLFEYRGNTFSVSISQGLAEWPKHGKTPEELIAAADSALYKAKAAGRNCICTVDE